ncbi:MAG TPA: sigma-54 dependent transcriptional regulator [Saprospiraceae bacterium]|nr:sigma-54 dependent transcriptional regulator [Saprospiraceae bacterium]
MARILIVDDEAAILNSLKEILEYEKHEVETASDGVECITKIKTSKKPYDVVLLDIKMPNMDGMDALERIRLIDPDLPVIMVSGHGTIDTAVEAVKLGAFDFIPKPPDINRILITVRNALDRKSLITETKTLKKQVSKGKVLDILGQSKAIEKVKHLIEKTGPTGARVMILGPNGSGKELVARWLHEKSDRAENTLVEVNCAAIPSELIESELFGHKKGSFTGAIDNKKGKFELADGGTLFLDEIGDMSLKAQAKVLRALETNKITPVGGSKEIEVDVRVVAATNKNLPDEIKRGNFREDLYFRLNTIVIHVPALRDRIDDVPILIEHFIKLFCSEYGIPVKKITKSAVQLLQKMPWEGNVRELRNVIERLIILGADKISDKDIKAYVAPLERSGKALDVDLEEYQDLDKLLEHVKKEYKDYKSN